MNIMIIGALTAKTSDPQVSGTVISLKHLIAGLRTLDNISVTIVDVGEIKKSRSWIMALCSSVKEIWVSSENTDVITIHQSPVGFAILSLPLLIVARLRKQPIIFRMFGTSHLFVLTGLLLKCLRVRRLKK